MRRSLEVSLRIKPTDIPSTPRAITIPKTVAQVITANDVGWSFFDSTESCVVEAASSALLIWEALKACVPWTSQSVVVAWMWNSFIACSVITVLGAEVPAGRALTSWMTGLARQSVAALQFDSDGGPEPFWTADP